MGKVLEIKCPDCGPVPIHHGLSKAILIIDWLSTPLNKVSIALTRLVSKIFNGFGIDDIGYIFWLLSKVGLAKVNYVPDDLNSDRAKCIWEAANARGIKVKEIRAFGRTLELFVAEYNGKKLLFEGLPRPKGPHSKGYYWMDNKAQMRAEFIKAGIPVAFGGVAFTFNAAKKVLERVKALHQESLISEKSIGSGFVITKPHIGSRSRHTNIHLETEQDLMRGFKIAKKLSPFVIVEQELAGMVHRAAVLGGKLVAVLRREPPYVVGDGVSTVKQLIVLENENPKRQGPYFHQIPIDEQTEAELVRLGLSYDFVPSLGQTVIVRNNIGRSSGGSNSDVTDLVHPDNKILFEKVATVVGDSIIGIDFIIEDISKSWKEQYPCGVIECNSVPFLDLHHFPLRGKAIDTSSALWDVVWPETKPVL